ncbi:MAG: PAS domain-containing sensor histidine kinase [Acidobacteriia bacterium]|nr:PAS domain-containing sensor histidine kinase [Terriglobia bacterium]
MSVLPRVSLLAVLVMLAAAAGTWIAWRTANTDEHSHIKRMTWLNTVTVLEDLTSDMDALVHEQVRLAKLWELEEPSYAQWTSFAGLFIEHHPGCLAIEWLDPKYEEHWTVGPYGAKTGPPLITGGSVREQLLNKAMHSGEAAMSPMLISSSGEKQWLTVVPIYQKNQFRGYVVGTFDAKRSLDTMLADIMALPFSGTLEENGEEFYRLPGSTDEFKKEWGQETDAHLPGTTWKLRVWPSPEVMGDMQSILPRAIVVFGGLLGLMLAGILQINLKLRTEISERGQAEEALRISQARFAGILEISAAAVISIDEQHRITLFNRSAESTFGYTSAEVMGKPLEILIPERFREVHNQHFDRFAQSGRENMLMSQRNPIPGLRKDGDEFLMTAALSQLEVGGEKVFTVICSDVTNQVRAEEELRRTHDELERRVQARTAELENANVALQVEVTERKLAEEEVLNLSGRLMRVQDEERRKLARELHDSAAQTMVSVSLNLSFARDAMTQDAEARTKIEESLKLMEQCTNELRTISYLLHPPLLEELGLSRSLRGFVEGFRRRCGIEVGLEVQPELERLDFEVELTIFRIVQEALSNIHRHSESSTAGIQLCRKGSSLTLEIADHGRGIRAGVEGAGVGIAGMRERVRLLQGQLEITSSSAGTTIRVVLPVTESRSASSGSPSAA